MTIGATPARPPRKADPSGSLRRIGALTFRIISQFRRDPRTLAMVVLAPVLVLTLLGYVITEKSTEVAVAIADLDEGAALPVPGRLPAPGTQPATLRLADELRRLLEERGMVLKTVATEDELRARVSEGDFKAGVIVPAGFTADLLAGRGLGDLVLVLEGTDSILAADLSRRFAQAVAALPEALAARLGSLPGGAPAGLLRPAGQPRTEFAYGGPELGALTYFAPGFIAFAAFFFTFLLTSVSFLRERASGTMERLLASPVTRAEIVLGYLFGFGLFALAQSLVILLFSIYVLGVDPAGGLDQAFVVEAALVAVAVVMGIFFSFYARNELQVVQFIPVVIIPQVVLSGFIVPLETMWTPLRYLAYAMPMTYANRALRDVIIRGAGLGDVVGDLALLAGFWALFTLLATRLIKRQVV
ncbi:MAG: ABC transporter permease [Firmicutes bacterium]|nr:ABC transporter permease [Bacillota bacterium]